VQGTQPTRSAAVQEMQLPELTAQEGKEEGNKSLSKLAVRKLKFPFSIVFLTT